jgi:hypothetical protein
MRFRFLLPYLVTVFLVFGVFTASKVNASSLSDVSMTMSPENPVPNQSVTITLSSYVDDLNSVLISWSVDGKKSLSGIDVTSLTVTAPALGKTETVVATVSLPDGDLNETMVIKPSIVVMLWQAKDSYVPPFYEGKAMPTSSSEIKVVAMPEIKNGSGFVDPSNLVYTWQLDQNNQEADSGYGKNSFTYVSDFLDGSNDTSVTISTLDQQSSAEGGLRIGTVSPQIDFYKDDVVLGTVWQQALSDGSQVSRNEMIQAIPYFISPKDFELPFLTFTWSINGTQVPTLPYNKSFLPLQTQAGASGTSNISLEIDSTNNITETASKNIYVSF